MTTRSTEILVGMFVALGLGALFVLAMKVSNLNRLGGKESTYQLTAYFQNIGGLKVRAPVAVSGVRVGRVTDIVYDPKRWRARVTMSIDAQQNYFPADTAASIYTAGLLGEQYVALEPGAEDEKLKNGGEISYTQGALVLEEIISRFISNAATGGGASKKDTPPADESVPKDPTPQK